MEMTMTMNEYQRGALETAIYPRQYKIIYPALGLNGEAGEVAEKVKKIMRGDDHGVLTTEKRKEIAKELGDVLWYVAVLANEIGFSLTEVAQMNYDKLKSRADRGKLSGDGDNR